MTTTTRATRKHRLAAAGAIVLVVGMLLAFPGTATAGRGKDQPAQEPVDISKLVWPAPPDVPRIRYKTAFAGEDDLNPQAKKRKSTWMDKMAGVSVPGQEGKPRMVAPYGVGFDSKGRIYVADSRQGVVFVFDTENKKVDYRGFQKLRLPAGVALDDYDRLFVSDSETHSIFVFKPEGGVEGVFGMDDLVRPVGLAIDEENRFLYVVDAKANRVVVFDCDTYKTLRSIGVKPTLDPMAPGVMDRPNSAAVDSEGNLYVTDTFNARIQVFNADGEFVRMWGKPGNIAGTFMRPKGVAVDSNDHVYVVDAEFNNVQVFNTEGQTLMFFGTRGLAPGSFTLATGIGIDVRTNRVVVTEQWLGRLQLFTYVPDADAAKEYEKAAKEARETAEKERAAREQRVAGSSTPEPSKNSAKN